MKTKLKVKRFEDKTENRSEDKEIWWLSELWMFKDESVYKIDDIKISRQKQG